MGETMATITLWAVVLTKSPGHVKTPYIVRDHTTSPHRFTLFEHEGDARREAAHFAESFPESAYEVVRLDGNIGSSLPSDTTAGQDGDDG